MLCRFIVASIDNLVLNYWMIIDYEWNIPSPRTRYSNNEFFLISMMNYFYKSMNHQRDKNFIFVTFTKKDEWFDINYSIYFYLHSKLDALGIFFCIN
jgi:hypothetical protein